MKKILVLEDEPNIRSFVVINLRRSGYEPLEAENGTTAPALLEKNPDVCLALLDVMLPDIDGFEVCRRIRASGSKIGIIMLTAKSQEIDKVTGLMTGATTMLQSPSLLLSLPRALTHSCAASAMMPAISPAMKYQAVRSCSTRATAPSKRTASA